MIHFIIVVNGNEKVIDLIFITEDMYSRISFLRILATHIYEYEFITIGTEILVKNVSKYFIIWF